MNEILEEFNKAKAEKRQPNCPFCGEPLTVCQTQFEQIRWEWNEDVRQFIKTDGDGDADKPFCVNCETQAWDFVDFDLVDY